MTSPLTTARNVIASRAESLLLGRVSALAGDCPISWQPSIFAPVFYGHRDYTADLSLPPDAQLPRRSVDSGEALPHIRVRLRVYFPSVDGSPADARLLRNCGRYPLVAFAHGNCGANALGGGGDGDHFLRWHLHAETLARCGNVVLVPDLPLTNFGGEGSDPKENDFDVSVLSRLIRWARTDWEYRDVVMPEPATGVAGHSFGATLVSRLQQDFGVAVAAHASLSDQYWGDVTTFRVPKLFMWGDRPSGEFTTVPIDGWEDKLRAPAHVLQFNGGHWDYLPPASSLPCSRGDQRGACGLVPQVTADVLALFFGRYLPPEKWVERTLASWVPSWLPWFRVPDSLRPPPLLLSAERAFFAGGHFSAWPLLGSRPECRVTLGWKTPEGVGSLAIE